MTGLPPLRKARFLAHSRTGRFRRKVQAAKGRLLDWGSRVSAPYIAFSTGKDSLCVLTLVRLFLPDTPAVYFDAESSFPETIEVLSNTPGLITCAADEPLLDTICRIGLDKPKALDRATMQSTVWGPIERLVARYGFDGVALGLRADESAGRRLNAYGRGSVYKYRRDGLWACQPLWDWRYDDVWAFIVSNELAYNRAYDKMWDFPEEDQRVSYWAGETKRTHGRYARLRQNYPDLFAQMVERLPDAGRYV